MRKILFCLVPGLLVAGLLAAGPARADLVGDTLQELGADKQLQEAGDSLQDAFTTVATKGRATRGAEGALAELITNSGELICNAWIISFRTLIRDMIIENTGLSGQQQTDHLQLIRQAQEFAALLEQQCTRSGLIGQTPDGGGGSGDGGGEESSEPPEMDPEPAVDRLDRQPGETVADAICRHRCQRYLNEVAEWQGRLDESDGVLQAARGRLAEAREALTEAQQEVAAAEREQERLNRIVQAGYNGNWSQARKDAWLEAERLSRTRAPANLREARARLAEAEMAVANAEASVANEESYNAFARRRVELARREYERCLRHCLTQAADAGDPTTTVCPEPAGHKSVSVGPNDKVGSSAQLGQDIKKSLGGGAGLGGLLGGSSGGTFGSKKSNPVPNRAGGGKQPQTADDPIDDDDKVDHEAGDTELEVGAMLVGDGLLVSAHIDEAPGDGTFQAVFLEDAYGRRMTPDRYDIYDLWREWTLTVWWTYDRWVDGQHVEHREGGWSESGRETMQIAALQPGSAAEEGIWNRLGFSSAAKGVQTLGAHFALKPEDLSEPVDLVIHTTLPEEDPVMTQPVVYRLSLENGSEVRLAPATATLAQARGCY